MEHYIKIKDGTNEQVALNQEPFVLTLTADNKFYQAVRNVGKILKEHGKVVIIGEGLCAQKAIAIADKIKESWYVTETIDIFDTEYKDVWIPKTKELGLENLEVTKTVPTTKIVLIQDEKPKQNYRNRQHQQGYNGKSNNRGKTFPQQNGNSGVPRNHKPKHDGRNPNRSQSESEGVPPPKHQDKHDSRKRNGRHSRTEGDEISRAGHNSTRRTNETFSSEKRETLKEYHTDNEESRHHRGITNVEDFNQKEPTSSKETDQNNQKDDNNHQKRQNHKKYSNPHYRNGSSSSKAPRKKANSVSSPQNNEP